MARLLTSIRMILVALPLAAFATPAANAASLASLSQMQIPWDGGDKPVPTWSGGTLVGVDGQGTSSILVHVFDRAGSQVAAFPFQIDGAQQIYVIGSSRNSNGMLAICGRATDRDGRGGTFAALISPDGQSKVIRTLPYAPTRVAVASDGSVWTVGYEIRDPATRPKPVKGWADTAKTDAPSVRRFDTAGKLVESFVPLANLSKPESVNSVGNYLYSTADGVVWYSHMEKRLIRISKGAIASDISGIAPLDDNGHMAGFAVTDDGHVYGAFVASSSAPRKTWLGVLDTKLRRWLPIQADPDMLVLFGADGNNLVGRVRGADIFHISFFGVAW